MNGNIPEEISDLTYLQNLDFGDNSNLSGSIPESIGYLSDLAVLGIYNCHITGEIPSQLSNLTNLWALGLFGNQLTGSLPTELGNLSNLVYCYLYDNQLSGTIPDEFGNLINLQYLNLRDNQFTGNIPGAIGNLTSLVELNLNNNQLSGSVPAELLALTNLIELNLGFNQLSGSIPNDIGSFGAFPDLQELYLNDNQFSGSIPSSIGNITALQVINAINNQLSGSIPSQIGNLNSLIQLRLSHNMLSGSIPSELGNLNSLVGLYVMDNQLTGTLPSEIGNLWNLEYLSLDENQFQGDVPSSITNISGLKTLLISSNQFTGLPNLTPIDSLHELYIENNKFTFEDIEPNINAASDVFVYAPQDSVGEVLDTTAVSGANLILTVSVGGTNNSYQWYRNGTAISGAQNDTLIINSFQPSNAGTYICGVTNSVVTSLTIYTKPITISINVPYPATYSLSNTTTFPSYSYPKDYASTDYRLVGLPGGSNQSISSFLTGNQGTDWEVYWDNGTNTQDQNVYLNKFSAGSADFNCVAGRAFWLVNKGPWTISTTVSSATLNANDEAVISIHDGWNIITNPFDQQINWAAIQAYNDTLNESIHAFNGSFSTAAALAPYFGYYFYNDPNDNRTGIRIPFSYTYTNPTNIPNPEPVAWKIKINLTIGENSDEPVYLGIANNAGDKLDKFDMRKPRAISRNSSIYFERPGWTNNYNIFSTDIRKNSGELQIWDFNVYSQIRDEASLNFENVLEVPEQLEVYLVDLERASYFDLRKNQVYSFIPVKDISRFQVIIGKPEQIISQLNSTLPTEFTLGNNYPNPFNPTTLIPFSIPEASQVKLIVYNILGQQVKVLYDGIIEPGNHYLMWDGSDSAGRRVASGVYLYTLRTNKGKVFTNKMVLTK